MIIPKKFKLAGIEWKVIINPHLSALGECHPQKGIIFIRDPSMPQPLLEQTFCHELVHAILFSTGDNGPHDEKFVDGFAYLLHQYMITAK